MKPALTIERSGPSGNIFMAVALAIKVLQENGQATQATELETKITTAMKEPKATYIKMLNIIDQYVDLSIK